MVAGLMVGAALRSKSARRLVPREASFVDPPLAAPFDPLVDLGGEDLGQEGEVALLGALGDLGQAAGVAADDGEAQLPGGGPDGGGRGGVGHGGHLASRRSS